MRARISDSIILAFGTNQCSIGERFRFILLLQPVLGHLGCTCHLHLGYQALSTTIAVNLRWYGIVHSGTDVPVICPVSIKAK